MPTKGTAAATHHAGSQNKWIILALCSSAYFFVFLHRMSTAVMVPDFQREFGASATLLGLLSSVHFYIYAAIQIPVGLMADRLGSKRVMLGGILIAIVGTVLFSLSPTLLACIIARAITSIGVAAIYVPSQHLLLEAFGSGKFSTATGFLIAVGQAGGLVAASPLAVLVQSIGWRWSFAVIAAATLVIFLLILFNLRVGRHGTNSAPAKAAEVPAAAATGPNWWGLGLLAGITFFSFGPLMGYQGLWGIPFLMDIHQLTRVAASNIIILAPLGSVIASLAMGLFLDRMRIKKSLILPIAVSVTSLCWVPLALFTAAIKPGLVYPISLLMGLANSTAAVALFGLAPFWLGTKNKATALGIMNTCTMTGGAIFQLGMGWIIDASARGQQSPLQQYHAAFFFGFLGVLVALAASLIVMHKLRSKREAPGVAVPVES